MGDRATEIAYVPQDDIVHRRLTVREALAYSARLRLPPDTSRAEIEETVKRVVDQLGLTERANVRIDRLSGGQRKRVGVAVELLSQPGLMFLDEPASGLDPGLERRIMELLRDLSRSGRAVVTVTHSTKHLTLCDKLVVMGRGGFLRYCGTPPEALAEFGVSEYDEIYTVLDESDGEADKVQSIHVSRGRRAPSIIGGIRQERSVGRDRQPAGIPQSIVLTQRYFRTMLRDRRNLAILLGQAPVLALAIAVGFNGDTFAAGPRSSAPTFLFITGITAIWLGAIAAAREIVKERGVFLRERAVGVSIRAYLISKVAVLFSFCSVQIGLVALILFGLRPLHAESTTYAETTALLLLT